MLAMVGPVGSGTLLWVWVAVLVACCAMRSSNTAGIQLWVWGALLVAKLAVLNFAASVEPLTFVPLWWVWVSISVVRWAVSFSDALVGQVTRLELLLELFAWDGLELLLWLVIIVELMEFEGALGRLCSDVGFVIGQLVCGELLVVASLLVGCLVVIGVRLVELLAVIGGE